MEEIEDPLARFGLDAIDLRWTLKDIAAKRAWIINKTHVAQLIELGLVEMRDDQPILTHAGRDTVWSDGALRSPSTLFLDNPLLNSAVEPTETKKPAFET